MENENTCSCGQKTAKTVFACSGAADLGLISDQVARRIHLGGQAQMKCLAFIGAGIQKMIDSVKDSEMVVIDGCPLDCGRLTMEKNGLANYKHVRLTDYGYTKGQTPASEENIAAIYEKVITKANL